MQFPAWWGSESWINPVKEIKNEILRALFAFHEYLLQERVSDVRKSHSAHSIIISSISANMGRYKNGRISC
jgi:hypothetical protein